jgi:ketosteroid isomerase-like protein
VSSEDNNKALARRFLEAFANGDLGTLDELLASDFVNHNPLPGQDPGREGYMRTAAEKHAAFSDIEINPKKSINCQARSVALYVSLRNKDLLVEALSGKAAFVGLLDGGSTGRLFPA